MPEQEAQTRFDKINPKLAKAGWGVVTDSRILVEHPITRGKISATVKHQPLWADYVLVYKGVKLAIVEAKSIQHDVSDGVMQAKKYANMLNIRFTYATNGDEIYAIDMEGEEGEIDTFPTPDELWNRIFGDVDEWRDKFYNQPLFDNGTKTPRYYQEIAINKVLEAVAKGKDRILLTLATGTGKTFIAFQIAYKLFQTKWNVKKTNNRPRILFLADRNVLANQAFNGFFGFPQDALVRIKPNEIRRDGRVPTNGSVFFTIFQTFQCGEGGKEYFGQYQPDFFDFIIIDECHRGGAKDESQWRGIMEYFSSAVQLGLTATPKRDFNADTYKYFGEPVYQYSLKQGIFDGYLTPFRHCKMQSGIDDYIYSPEDEVLSGTVEKGKVYDENDFYQGNIKIKKRDESRVAEFMRYIQSDEKTLVFCYTQDHAGQIRDMINQYANKNGFGNPLYCVRVTANDGATGDEYLAEFQDNEKTIPTVLTTSEKLSTGVDALNVRNIVLLRPINSMIEFKQIIGRGTRLFDGKYYFTIYDFVKAYEHFNDTDWDGEPVCSKCGNNPCTCTPPSGGSTSTGTGGGTSETPAPPETPEPPKPTKEILEIRLSDGNVRRLKYIKTDMFYGADGKPVTIEDFINEMYGRFPSFFSSIQDLQEKWSTPKTRNALLDKMADAGYGKDILKQIRTLIEADNCDLLDVLEYLAYNNHPIARAERTKRAEPFCSTLTKAQQDFVAYLINAYIKSGVEELDNDKLDNLLSLKFGSLADGVMQMGGVKQAKETFLGFQRSLYVC
ncbi:MAG: DEAD/DEAH box helicase family protein [Paludibacteraceae bacterium]|nr:DEAD/DEAH box helicase family protein [Paludibacteraceae bacterium]